MMDEEDQGIRPESTPDEEKSEMEINERDEEVYDKEGREQLVEDDEISPEEEGFMEGASGIGKSGMCANCGKVLDQNPENVVEREIDGENLYFCSPECRDTYQ